MITVLLFIAFFLLFSFLARSVLVRVWYRYQLKRHTRKARLAKAHWLSTKETLQKGQHWDVAENNYCTALVRMRTYEKLLSPMQAVVKSGE